MNQTDSILVFFTFGHLPPNLQEASRPFMEHALTIEKTVAPGPQRAYALQRLLEAKDAVVRATLHPGA